MVWKILAVVALITLPVSVTFWRKSHKKPEMYRWDVAADKSLRVFLRNGTCGFRLLSMPDPSPLESAFRGPLAYDPSPKNRRFVLSSTRSGPYRITWFVFPFWLPTLALTSLGAIPVIRGPVRRSWRRSRGLCEECGYNLQGNRSGRCSECGTRFR